jgi:putative SOS response-associated peptidase YedK
METTFDEFSETRILPRFNIAPSQFVPIVRLMDDNRILSAAAWGFVPFWQKGKPNARPINARSETVATSGMFRTAFKSSRCLVPADGFYEWLAGTPKQPFLFHRPDDALFAFAGLCSEWDGQMTCLHLTTTPNAITAPVHDRMPVILHKADYSKWLDPAVSAVELTALLVPYPDVELVSQPVSTRFNSPMYEGDGLMEA